MLKFPGDNDSVPRGLPQDVFRDLIAERRGASPGVDLRASPVAVIGKTTAHRRGHLYRVCWQLVALHPDDKEVPVCLLGDTAISASEIKTRSKPGSVFATLAAEFEDCEAALASGGEATAQPLTDQRVEALQHAITAADANGTATEAQVPNQDQFLLGQPESVPKNTGLQPIYPVFQQVSKRRRVDTASGTESQPSPDLDLDAHGEPRAHCDSASLRAISPVPFNTSALTNTPDDTNPYGPLDDFEELEGADSGEYELPAVAQLNTTAQLPQPLGSSSSSSAALTPRQ